MKKWNQTSQSKGALQFEKFDISLFWFCCSVNFGLSANLEAGTDLQPVTRGWWSFCMFWLYFSRTFQPPHRHLTTTRTHKDWTHTQEVKTSKQIKTKGVLTCQDDHVHSPEDAHDPADHDDSCQDLDEGRRHVEPEHAAHSPLWDQLAASPAQHRERWDEGTCVGRASSLLPGGRKLHSSLDILWKNV